MIDQNLRSQYTFYPWDDYKHEVGLYNKYVVK